MAEPRCALVTGASGLVGGRLARALIAQGQRVRSLTRSEARVRSSGTGGIEWIAWDGTRPPASALAGAALVVHLAGEPVFGGLGAAHRERVRASRVDSTRALVGALAALPAGERPTAFACASAVGYYGSRGDEELTEDAPPGTGFLADVCRAWEDEARRAEDAGVRSASFRIGVVLAREGGALPRLLLPFRLGLGGRVGDGKQWFPWIHADDVAGLICAFAVDSAWRGAINAVAPDAVRNTDFTRALAQALGRPALLPVPAFALRAALGELAQELLGSRRVVPRRAQERGFRFAFPGVEAALARELA